jgi:WD40 repeat protein
MSDARQGWAVGGTEEEIGYSLRHILRTEDGGLTWSDVTPPESFAGPDYWWRVSAFFLDQQTAWVAYPGTGSRAEAVWRTHDGGQTWDRGLGLEGIVCCGMDAGFDLEFVDQTHGWLAGGYLFGAGSSGTELFRTTDGGITWDLEWNEHGEAGIDSWLRCCETVFEFVDSVYGWAVSNDHNYEVFEVQWTDDGGMSWRSQGPFEPIPEGGSRINVDPGTGYDGLDYEVACEAGPGRLFSSSQASMAVRCFGPDGNHDYLFTTRDAGNSWDRVAITATIAVSTGSRWPPISIHFESPSSIFLVAQTGPTAEDPNQPVPTELLHSGNGGRSWDRIGSLPLLDYLSVVFAEGQPRWIVGPAGLADADPSQALYRSDDGGRTWVEVVPKVAAGGSPSRLGASPPPVRLPANREPILPLSAAKLQVLDQLPVEAPSALAIRGDGELVAVGSAGGQVVEWSTGFGPVTEQSMPTEFGVPRRSLSPRTLPGAEDWIYTLFYAGPSVVSVSRDGSLRAVEPGRLREGGHAAFPGGEVAASARSPQAGSFATGGEDGVVRLWNVEGATARSGWEPEAILEGHSGWVWALAFSLEGGVLASAGEDRLIRLWDVESQEVTSSLRGHTSTISDLAFSPDGQTLASASWDGTVRLWDVATWTEIRRLEGHSDWVLQVAFSPDGDLLASSSADGTVLLWNPATGEPLGVLEHGGPVRGVEFFPDGTLLATIADDNWLRFWGIGN